MIRLTLRPNRLTTRALLRFELSTRALLRFELSLLALCAFGLCGGGARAAEAPDVDALYIERTPRIAFNAADTTYKSGLPKPGQAMTYLAHVKNWGDAPVTLPYEWRLDGAKADEGSLAILAGAEAKVPFLWTWEPSDHTLEFIADPGATLAERSRLNNRVEIRTNALTVGLWVERGLYDYFHQNQYRLNDGANGFEDWGQRMIRRWNDLMARAVYPASPNGMLDRLALDKVVVVANGKLPLAGGLPTNNPDGRDQTVDLQWGYPWHPNESQPGQFYGFRWNGPFYLDFGSIHEMNHARFQIDLYGLDENQQQNPPAGEPLHVQVTDANQRLVAGTSAMPFIAWDVVYYNKWRDLMGAGPSIFDAYTAGVWNWKAHKRGRGNQNAPPDIGVFLNDLPQRNHLRLVNQNGQPLVGATVSVYQATSGSGWYTKVYDNTADLSFTTDATGTVNLPRNPFGAGNIQHGYGYSNGLALVKVQLDGKTYFLWLEVTDFNMAYWRGETQDATYSRNVDVQGNGVVIPANSWRGSYFNGGELGAYVASRSDARIDLEGAAALPDGVNASSFSAYWQGNFAFTEGWKTFTLTSDGGLQLLMDGRLVFDAWGNTTPRTWTPTLYTTSGSPYVTPGRTAPNNATHRLELRYRSGEGPLRASVSWTDAAPPSEVPVNAWRADYYSAAQLKGLITSRTEAAIDNDYADGSPDPTLGGDNWSARWTGDWDFDAGEYAFTATMNDGMRVWVDDEKILDKWQTRGSVLTTTVNRALTAGRHRVRVEYFESGGAATARLNWKRLPPQTPGDVNGDTKVDVRDAQQALQALVGMITLTPDAFHAADMDGDGRLQITDVVGILKRAVGLPSFNPASAAPVREYGLVPFAGTILS